ncbi:hypothetical protein V4V36_31100 [Paenibacillus lautus]|uniref:hypothetical protein n=1 Tax=Paenibacillus lautus TaxID=1401 RepID=UPI002FBEB8C6
MKNSSRSGNTVADFFGASGSTLTTCDQLGRPCRTMELIRSSAMSLKIGTRKLPA